MCLKRLTAKFQANKLIQQIAPIVGGKGGGRPESAQGAGKDASKINEALAKARELQLTKCSQALRAISVIWKLNTTGHRSAR